AGAWGNAKTAAAGHHFQPTAHDAQALAIRMDMERLAVAAWLEDEQEVGREPIHGVPGGGQRADADHSLPKKSLPLSSTTMNAGKSFTSICQIASMPSSG